MSSKIINIFLLVILFCSLNLLAQNTPQQPQQQRPTAKSRDQVIELGEIKIDARVELPQVQILSRRLQSHFDDVQAEKSFLSELSPSSEQLKFNAITSGKVEPIQDINSLLNKKRF